MEKEFYNKLVCTEGLTKIDWLKVRQKGIGGSDISSVCNINPWHSSLALYYDKVTEITEVDEGNVSIEIGTALEPLGRAKFEKWINKNFLNLLPLLLLQFLQAGTMLLLTLSPPLEIGITWSLVGLSNKVNKSFPQ